MAVPFLVASWVLLWAAVVGRVSMTRGGSRAVGMLWGFFLGPIGLVIVLWTTRSGHDRVHPGVTTPVDKAPVERQERTGPPEF